LYSVRRREWRALSAGERGQVRKRALATLQSLLAPTAADGEAATGQGWSAVAEVVGSASDIMVMHFRPTLDAIGVAQTLLKQEPLFDYLQLDYSFLSVTEAGFSPTRPASPTHFHRVTVSIGCGFCLEWRLLPSNK
jgi:chlorite dismutase